MQYNGHFSMYCTVIQLELFTIYQSEINREKNKSASGFTLVELMIVSAVILLVATPFVRYFYRDELKKFERQLFSALGIGETAQFLILSILAITVIYFKFRPDFIEAKRKNKPVISKPVKIFTVFSLLIVGVLLVLFRS